LKATVKLPIVIKPDIVIEVPSSFQSGVWPKAREMTMAQA
jgi:hypothetical protein